MRKKIIAGNWKMNLDKNQVVDLIENIITNPINQFSDNHKLMILAPSFVYLESILAKTKNVNYIKIAAQNCSEHQIGAYTGEVAASMLKSIGVEYCIVGHSERRQYYHERDEVLLQKVNQILQQNIAPIFCCGEPLSIREDDSYFSFIEQQLNDVIFKLDENDFRKIIIAYEPIWAIGTGKTASDVQTQEVHQFIRELIKNKFNNEIAEQTTILYGGSVNATNAAQLFNQKDIDGALVGGASLKYQDFITIANAL